MKLRLIPMVVAMLLSVVMASPALSRAKLTTTERIVFFKKKIKHDTDVIEFFKHNPKLLYKSDSVTRLIAQRQLKVHTLHLRWMKNNLKRVEINQYPPHHALWMCIHGDPAYGSHYGNEASSWSNKDTGHNGHYGGLQMHPDWGFGTTHHASDDSQLTQEWAAEKGYKANHYSSGWLNGQWGQTVGPCWKYA